MSIKNVRYEKKEDYNENEDRVISTLLDNEFNDFEVHNVRLVEIKSDKEIGNHWREYPEIYGLIGGATITLEDIETKERKVLDLKTGDRLYIPPRVGLKINAEIGTFIVTCSPKADRESETHKYILH